jgi:uncharacterized protein YggE
MVEPDARGGVTVYGAGTVRATPDVVTAVLGAHVRADDVQQALARAEEAVAALRASLLADGATEPDLRTEATNVWRDDSPRPKGSGRPAVTVRLTLRAVIRDVAAAGQIVHRALAAAGDAAQLDSLTFGITDPDDAARQAREAAFADARAKAEQYATLAGGELGQVVEVEDAGGAPPAPRPLARNAVAMAAALPVDAGEQEVAASVRVRWAWA